MRLAAPLFSLLFAACGGVETAVLWTDRPETALYAQYYNAAQGVYKIEAHFIEAPAARLAESREKPDIVIASFLNNANAMSYFEDLRFLFYKNILSEEAFYPALLEMGRRGRRQLLLPVSFNLPAVAFAPRSGVQPQSPFVLELDELKAAALAYNQKDAAGVWTRVGFSPLWDRESEFLFLAARLYGADFTEADGALRWNDSALEEALGTLGAWLRESTGNIQAEDDFIYKYFFDPPAKLLADGRILFAFMKSSEYFTQPERAALDVRWLAREGRIPVLEESVSFGIHKNAAARRAAVDFARWFFTGEAQDTLLKKSRAVHLDDAVFGIAGGFSALWQVTEFVFPKYYKELLGRAPPAASLAPVSTLPDDWNEIKSAVVIPYMRGVLRKEAGQAASLGSRFAEWRKIKQTQF
jgi:hypothetical protein